MSEKKIEKDYNEYKKEIEQKTKKEIEKTRKKIAEAKLRATQVGKSLESERSTSN